MKAGGWRRRALFSAVALVLLTGCWNRRELNELAIAAALGIDKSESGLKLSVQVINPGEIADRKGAGKQPPVVTFEAEGRTFMEALHRLTTEMPRRIYLAHLRMVIIGEEMARSGIGKALDALSRYYEVRTDYYVVVARGQTAAHILETLTSLEKIPANSMNTSLDISEKAWAATGKTTLNDLISGIHNIGRSAVMSGITLDGNPADGPEMNRFQSTKPPVILRYSGIGAMKGDKLAGWLSETESKGFRFAKGNLTNTGLVVPCPAGGYADVELVRMNSKVKGKVAGGSPAGSVTIRVEGMLTEVSCDIDVMKRKTISRLEREIEDEIEEAVHAAVRRSQDDLRSDVIGFGEAIHRANPKAWRNLKRNWPQAFRKMKVDVNVDMKIRRIGTVNEPAAKKTEE
ncbi:Ger(x)C family spore germination protein [Cohnella caldifontis]|uniref:Ger(x)C family spore germination protein n=1 Tax=Cohnella caldifontis TaxID=3027471 RepID=UPI0023EB4A94|nr:Ger(x)C family spore germination protein [Cohnella sp. YIM B05605]